MKYKKAYADLEDFANELLVHKSKQAFFAISVEQEPIEENKKITLEDGSISYEKTHGVKYSASIYFSALGFSNTTEGEKLQPDVLLVYSQPIIQKSCFTKEDLSAFNSEVEKGWKNIINEIKRIWGGAFFEGAVSFV